MCACVCRADGGREGVGEKERMKSRNVSLVAWVGGLCFLRPWTGEGLTLQMTDCYVFCVCVSI